MIKLRDENSPAGYTGRLVATLNPEDTGEHLIFEEQVTEYLFIYPNKFKYGKKDLGKYFFLEIHTSVHPNEIKSICMVDEYYKELYKLTEDELAVIYDFDDMTDNELANLDIEGDLR